MKLQNVVTTKITIEPNVVEKESRKSAPTPAEIRLRALEIHIEGGGIHRLAMNTWQQADSNFKKGPNTGKEKQERNEKRDRDDIEIRERSATMKSLSLFGWYRVLRTQHRWTVFEAIRYLLWLAR